MKKTGFTGSLLLMAQMAIGQLAPGSIAPDFTATDLNGNTWHLYDILDQGKPVVIDISATWCGPCWNYHQTGNLETLYDLYGPNGTNELMVLFIEGDAATSIDNLHGIGTNTQGDWVTGTPYPIIDNAVIAHDGFAINYFPTIYYICPNRLVNEIGQLPYASIHNFTTGCEPATGINNAAALKYEGPSGSFCEKLKFTPAFYLQNLGTAPLQSATLDLLLDGSVTQTIPWTGNLSTYATALVNFQEIEISSDVELTVRVSQPNNTTDEVPANNELQILLSVSPSVEMAVLDLELKFDNFPASNYWEITDANGNVLYYGGNPLAKYTGVHFVKEYATPNALVHHTLALPADGCYEFAIYDVIGDGMCCGNGQGYYKLKDFSGNILAAGAAFGSEKHDPFGIHNTGGTKDNASLLRLEHLDDDFCDSYVVHPVVDVQNSGNNTISSIDFTVSGNNGTYFTQTWNGTIFPGSTLPVTLNAATISQTDVLKVAINKVNGQSDTLSFRNAVEQKLIRRTTPKTSWIIDMITDLHGWETYWQLTDDAGAILASGGNPLVGINGGGLGIAQSTDPGAYHAFEHIQQTITLPSNGCYHFTVVDDAGNGMGLGLFGNPTPFARIRNPQVGIITGTDGDFFEVYKSNIGLQAPLAANEPDWLSDIQVFPNPADNQLQVTLPAKAAMVHLFNCFGQKVWENNTSGAIMIIPAAELANGCYYLEINLPEATVVKPVVVQH